MVNGLSGERMLIGLAIGIAVPIFLVLKTKVQAFLALIICTVIVGVVGGMPLLNTTIEVDGVEKTFGIINSITSRVWWNTWKYRYYHRFRCYDGTDL